MPIGFRAQCVNVCFFRFQPFQLWLKSPQLVLRQTAGSERRFVPNSSASTTPNPATAEIGELRPYDLRQTFASLLLVEGHAIHYVAEQLGHDAEQTLRTYGHVIADYRDREAIDAEAEIPEARASPGASPAMDMRRVVLDTC